jgi:hypothetical protein
MVHLTLNVQFGQTGAQAATRCELERTQGPCQGSLLATYSTTTGGGVRLGYSVEHSAHAQQGCSIPIAEVQHQSVATVVRDMTVRPTSYEFEFTRY